jgi:hypothetical protein
MPMLPMLPTLLSQKWRRSISPLTQLGIGGTSPFLGKPRRQHRQNATETEGRETDYEREDVPQ